VVVEEEFEDLAGADGDGAEGKAAEGLVVDDVGGGVADVDDGDGCGGGLRGLADVIDVDAVSLGDDIEVDVPDGQADGGTVVPGENLDAGLKEVLYGLVQDGGVVLGEGDGEAGDDVGQPAGFDAGLLPGPGDGGEQEQGDGPGDLAGGHVDFDDLSERGDVESEVADPAADEGCGVAGRVGDGVGPSMGEAGQEGAVVDTAGRADGILDGGSPDIDAHRRGTTHFTIPCWFIIS
jgi:hypothetical protein